MIGIDRVVSDARITSWSDVRSAAQPTRAAAEAMQAQIAADLRAVSA
jgi:hypothetical protein